MKKYEEILNEELNKNNNQDFFILGETGIGKSYFIKNFLENYKNKEKYNYYSIINAYEVIKSNIINEIYYHRKKINPEYVEFASKKNFSFDNFIIVLDEINSIPEHINKDELISKLINLKNKYTNIKIIYVSNQIPEYFYIKNEKLYSKILNIKENELFYKYDFKFISEETNKKINKYNLNKNNLRLFSILEDVFNYIDIIKINYSVEEEISDIIKEKIYLQGHIFFSKNNYLNQLRKELSNSIYNDIDFLNVFKKETEVFQNILNFEYSDIIKHFEFYEANIDNYYLEKNIYNYYDNLSKLNINSNLKYQVIELLEKNYKSLSFHNDTLNMFTNKSISYWIEHYLDNYNTEDIDFIKISNVLKNKFIFDLDFINNNELNYYYINIKIKDLESFRNFMEKNETTKEMFVQCHSLYENMLSILIDKEKMTKNQSTDVNYLFMNDRKTFVKELINRSKNIQNDLNNVTKDLNETLIHEFRAEVKTNLLNNDNFKEFKIDKLLEIIFK